MIYFVQNLNTKHIKIGVTNHLKERFNVLNVHTGDNIILLKTIKGDNIIEGLIHHKLKQFNLKGEWYKEDPVVLEFIKNIPTTNLKYIFKFIDNYNLIQKNDIKSDYVEQFVLDNIFKHINERLDKARLNSRNSGFSDGIRFAQNIIKTYTKFIPD